MNLDGFAPTVPKKPKYVPLHNFPLGKLMEKFTAFYESRIARNGEKLILSMEQKIVIVQLLAYFSNMSFGELVVDGKVTKALKLNRGLFLHGSLGIGKSELIMALHLFFNELCEYLGRGTHSRFVDMPTFSRQKEDLSALGKRVLILDDLFRNSVARQDVSTCLDIAYIRFKKSDESRLIIISNYPIAFLTEIVDDFKVQICDAFLQDRIKEMCQEIEYKGKNHRQNWKSQKP